MAKRVGEKRLIIPPKKKLKKLSVEEWKTITQSEWFRHVDLKEARKEHNKNILNCKEALREYNKKDRPLRILALHGSGRNIDESCAHELSNSAMLLEKGLEALSEFEQDIEYEIVQLRHYKIEYCNGCYSSSSALCHFPCTCFPLDPMQELYPKVLKADILLISTPVNQSMAHGRLKAFIDRLISLDGGFHVNTAQFVSKDSKMKQKSVIIETSKNFKYESRMFGRVSAYFISSKDENNDLGTNNDSYELWKAKGRQGLDPRAHTNKYSENISTALFDSSVDYGFFHPDKWYCVAASNPHEPMSYDKQRLSENTEAHEESKEVVRQAVKLAYELKDNPPKPSIDRINRT